MKNSDKVLKEVNYAYQNVPFYKKRFDSLGIDPALMSRPDELQQLPFSEKKDYRKHFPMGIMAKGFSFNHPMLTKSESSGSSGERVTTIEIGMLLFKRATACARLNENIAAAFYKKGRKICRYAAPNCSDVECANPNSTMEDRILADGTLVLPVYHDLLTTSDTLINRAIDEILDYQPDMFYVDPTHFAFLLRQFKKRGLTPPKVPVMTSYSAATQVSRRQIEAVFPQQSLFAELVSSSEMGWIAMECPHGQLHLNDESFAFEFIDQQGQAVAAGEMGELCISSIDQGASPHIRYKTGDMVRVVGQSCDCGSTCRRIIMEGRLSHFITRKGQPIVSPRQIDDMIGSPNWLDLYQFEQSPDDTFLLKMITNEHYCEGAEKTLLATLGKGLGKGLGKALGEDVKVNGALMDYIASERSGKFQALKRG